VGTRDVRGVCVYYPSLGVLCPGLQRASLPVGPAFPDSPSGVGSLARPGGVPSARGLSSRSPLHSFWLEWKMRFVPSS